MQISASLIIRLIRFFNTIKLLEAALSIGFVKRRRSLQPDTIVKVFTFGLLNTPDPSLKQIASKCEEYQPGLEISKNAIFKRLKGISELMQYVFVQAIKMSLNRAIPSKTAHILSQFRDVKICDSSKISLPDKLADLYPGLGGRNAKSALKIQGVYSLLSSTFSKIEITKAPGSDTTYCDQLLSHIQKGELLIVDLGYFSKKFFSSISAKGAYYLSRIRKNTVVHIEQENRLKLIDLADLLRDKTSLDMDVILGVGSKDELTCRLVAIKLPDEVINERRRKANQKAKSQGKQLTASEIDLLAWNILITDVSKEQLTIGALCDLYRARWQIELMFKACKKHMNLDKVGQCGRNQLECLLYGRLIAIVLIYTMYNALYQTAYTTYKKEISILSFAKHWATQISEILLNLNLTLSTMKALTCIIKKIVKKSLHDKRSRQTTLEMLQGHTLPVGSFQNTG